jgi:glutaredoxin 3
MFGQLSQGKSMNIRLYSREICGWCIDAKKYLRDHNLAFEEVDVGKNPARYEEMKTLSGQTYVPTIVVDGQVLADFDVAQLEKFLSQRLGAGTGASPRVQ